MFLQNQASAKLNENAAAECYMGDTGTLKPCGTERLNCQSGL